MLRTIFEAECSLFPAEGILGKEQPLEVLKTSALNHIPTGRTVCVFVCVCVCSVNQSGCARTDVISLLTTSCATLHALVFFSFKTKCKTSVSSIQNGNILHLLLPLLYDIHVYVYTLNFVHRFVFNAVLIKLLDCLNAFC